jgi:glutamate synthase domain-containing protein 1
VRDEDRSACGVGALVSLKGEASHRILELGFHDALPSMPHRAGQAPDQEIGEDGTLLGTGDGMGIITALPQELLKRSFNTSGHPDVLGNRDLGVVSAFLPRDSETKRNAIRKLWKNALIERGYEDREEIAQTLWRKTPIDSDQLGRIGRETHPRPEQLLIPLKPGQTRQEFDFDMYTIMRAVEVEVRSRGLSAEGRNNYHILSASSSTINYKSLSLAHRFQALYPDLMKSSFATPFIGFHGRFSTNTAPAWWRAHFKRMLAHNGEINTVRGNVNAFYKLINIFSHVYGDEAPKVIEKVLNTNGTDSDMLDNAAQFLFFAGVSLALIKTYLLPPSLRPGAAIEPGLHEVVKFGKAVSSAWEGPAMVIMTDGRMVIAGGDMNGMRPTPWEIFGSPEEPDVPDILVIGSEAGMSGLPLELSIKRGSVSPGEMIGANVDPDLVINGQRIPIGFLDNAALQQIAVRDAQARFNYQTEQSRFVDIPRLITVPGVPSHG